MRIGVAATPAAAIPTLEWLLHSQHEIALIISQPDRGAGRGRELRASSVSSWAIDHNIALLRPDTPQELIGSIEDFDVVVTIGYGVLIPEAILKLARFGFLNLHFSLLPAYRGAAPVQRAIENGETQTGVTVFALDKGMDTGPIYSTVTHVITEQSRSLELMSELAQLAPKALEMALSAIEKGHTPTPQPFQGTYAPKISKQEAQIDWQLSAEVVLRRIRAFYPSPIAWSIFRDENFRVTRAEIGSAQLEPGQIALLNNQILVGCADKSAIALLHVIPAGRKEMAAADWSRGAHLDEGSHFG
ncbi:unannotated protein [freshwater metagenome]|uniref:methionyl-tRNA formyltransferase n=1 Tax=freshwater metagenome TaxID=449393 RepID=A0A6J7LSA6_9ZZZZ|nr:methionyl-tRNA formyltransferase [Actinomycetota bacterium]MSW62476.1 methionyl-tRNA formyltransferase [Actinomycetota bacterium]MSX89523.1 methionyl-tRNA formyltransferase [Actinomycetota bacterium]MSZ63854.1 methionyl-tRNA formyltransferase [Actinomycetota bacterium]